MVLRSAEDVAACPVHRCGGPQCRRAPTWRTNSLAAQVCRFERLAVAKVERSGYFVAVTDSGATACGGREQHAWAGGDVDRTGGDAPVVVHSDSGVIATSYSCVVLRAWGAPLAAAAPPDSTLVTVPEPAECDEDGELWVNTADQWGPFSVTTRLRSAPRADPGAAVGQPVRRPGAAPTTGPGHPRGRGRACRGRADRS